MIFYLFWQVIFLKKILFLERRKGREKGKETSISCLSHAPNWGPGPQPRDVLWQGREPAALQFPGQRSVLWATPARVASHFQTNICNWQSELILSLKNDLSSLEYAKQCNQDSHFNYQENIDKNIPGNSRSIKGHVNDLDT